MGKGNFQQAIKTLSALDLLSRPDGIYTGNIIDTKGFLGGMLLTIVGIATGSPTSLAIDHALEGSNDQAIWTPLVIDPVIAQWVISDPSVASLFEFDFHISSTIVAGNTINRYVREIFTLTFTGGTVPAVHIGGLITLGDADHAPVRQVA